MLNRKHKTSLDAQLGHLSFPASLPCLPYFSTLEEQALLTRDKGSSSFAHQHTPAVCFCCHCQVLGTKWKWPAASATQLLEPRRGKMSAYRACTHKSFWCGKIQSRRARCMPYQRNPHRCPSQILLLYWETERKHRMRLFSITQLCWREDSRWWREIGASNRRRLTHAGGQSRCTPMWQSLRGPGDISKSTSTLWKLFKMSTAEVQPFAGLLLPDTMQIPLERDVF